ncbi:MAG: DUF202 domain-containing protein [Hyphomicrobiaceae bacterium]|nr:DUF202 domain-containing protein [Hyphomicrobiaceae bacterium]
MHQIYLPPIACFASPLRIFNRLWALQADGTAFAHSSQRCNDQPMGATMIKHYTDHAANERTFLAWIRTGITITVFGFVIEKFELFVRGLPPPAVSAALIRAFPKGQFELVSLLFIVTGIGVFFCLHGTLSKLAAPSKAMPPSLIAISCQPSCSSVC